MPYLYTRLSIYCRLSICVTVASVSSHLVVRTRRFWKIKEKKIEKKINIDLAMIASQSSERQFMTPSAYLFAYNCDLSRRLHIPDLRSSPLSLIKGHTPIINNLTFVTPISGAKIEGT